MKVLSFLGERPDDATTALDLGSPDRPHPDLSCLSGVLRPRSVRCGEAIIAASQPARLSWRKHDGVLAIVLEGIAGHFDITLYRLGHKTCRPIVEDSIEGSLANARQEADGLVRDLLEHQCGACSGWV
ncbi:MAG TPA: hypothetical protein VN461_11340 [Vicinamibacteria bacterium]|jgi:hypothetical protein|nr:hypothetical protein [Vicinamibacteria bacterium]